VPFTGSDRHWQLQIPAHSADRTGHSRGADSRARRKTSGWYRLALKWHQPPNLSLRGGRRPTWQSREGSCDFAGSTQLSGQVLRDCHVASLLAMTRQESARCTSALARLNCPPRGAQGTPLQTQLVPIVLSPDCSYRQCAAGSGMPLPYNFLSKYAKKLPEAQASGSFSNTINHNQLFTSRRPSSGGRSGAGRPHSPEPSGPRAAACSNR